MNQAEVAKKFEEASVSVEQNVISEPVKSCKQNLLNTLAEGTVLQRKSYFIQFLLSSAFGPLGLLYSSATATLVMIAVTLFIIIMVNTSYTDAPTILYYGTAYVVIVIANAISVLVGFFTVNSYNQQRIAQHMNLIKDIIQCLCNGDNVNQKDGDIANNEHINADGLPENASNNTLNSILWIVISVAIIAFLYYKSNYLSGVNDAQSSTYEETRR